MILLGIDEAGRGPVIGPMVMAGAAFKKEDEEKLMAIGVKDSKLLSPRQRERLFEEIKKLAVDYKIIIVPPQEIDRAVESDFMNLNLLEAQKGAEIMNAVKHNLVILDCPSTNTRAYSDTLREMMIDKEKEMICVHKADRDYVVVGAASILAKVTRDREIEQIKKKIKQDFGSGYPADPITRAFLEKNWNKYPEIFRQSWETYKRVKTKQGQAKLYSF